MVTLRLGSSLLAVLFLLPSLGGFAACAFLDIHLGSPLAAAGAVLFAASVWFLGGVLLRRSRTRPDEVVVTAGPRGAAATGTAFITFARHSLGLWSQPGVVMVADHGGIFLPMGFARHLIVEFVLTVFAVSEAERPNSRSAPRMATTPTAPSTTPRFTSTSPTSMIGRAGPDGSEVQQWRI